jgi:imidazole glycerol-phosphate synthase subunit HisH
MEKKKIAIINIGIGNSKSIYNALFTLGYDCTIIQDGTSLNSYSHAILPGVGAFDEAVTALHEKVFFGEIQKFNSKEKPILGICLGMQLLFSSSDEGRKGGLNLIPGNITRISPSSEINVPNTGWHDLCVTRVNKTIEFGKTPRMYHNHAFAFQDPTRPEVTALIASQTNIVVAVESNRVIGMQFHPEKSHRPGIETLRRFCEL